MFKSSLNQNTEHQLRYQETEFVISYEDFHRPEFTSVPLFKDEMVLVASKIIQQLKARYWNMMFITNNMRRFRSIVSRHLVNRGMTR